MALSDTLMISASGMQVQGERLRVVAENIANSESTAITPGGDPYRRKIITFQNALDKELGIFKVKVSKIGEDKSSFNKKYEPTHPAADAQGYVKYPNVNSLVEMADMREARRAYEANINMVELSKAMLLQTLQILNK